MRYTENYNLNKPEATDVINATSREAFNTNMDVLDDKTKTIENALETVINDTYYKPNDYWTPSTAYTTTGYVTSSGTKFYFNIAVPKSMKNISEINGSNLKVTILQNSSVLHGSSGGVVIENLTSFSSVSYNKVDDRNVRMYINVISADAKTLNNSPVAVAITSGSLIFS